MKNEDVNIALREYAQERLSPTKQQQSIISAIYATFCDVLGRDRCRQIGSYPRYTAIRPPHDLDILFKAGAWPNFVPDASAVVRELAARLQTSLKPPTGLDYRVVIQSHSVSVKFYATGIEEFAVDVVPGWQSGRRNEFGDDVFWVPEILVKGHLQRERLYRAVSLGTKTIDFILTDPHGYTSVAASTNDSNPDFRKSVKVVKKHNAVAKKANNDFKMKSFHSEQIVTAYFRENSGFDILAAVRRFFSELPQWLSHGQIADRADSGRMIDAYVDDLTTEQKAAIIEAGEEFLRRLEAFDGSVDAAALFEEKSMAATANRGTSSTISAPAIITEPIVRQPRGSFGRP